MKTSLPSFTTTGRGWKKTALAAGTAAVLAMAAVPLWVTAQEGALPAAPATPHGASGSSESGVAATVTPPSGDASGVPAMPATPQPIVVSPQTSAFKAPSNPDIAAASIAYTPPATPVRDAQVVRGEYLARAGDCISCHTSPKGLPFAGGLSMDTPFGAIVSTNITPDKTQGIGQYTQEDFTRALREGKAKDGHHLYPAMPYTNFARLDDEDLSALYAYFMKGVQPATQDNAKTDLPWPFSMRWLMAGWNMLYLPGKPYQPVAAQSAEWNRGAYLVQGLGHCSACHTPRSLAGGEKASSEKDGDLFLSGAIIDGWYAQPLRNTTQPGLATWSQQELVDYLKAGRTDKTAAFGPMTEVIANSTQHMSREDLTSIAVYLKSLNGKDGSTVPVTPAPATTMTGGAVAGGPVATALQKGDTGKVGAMVYLNNCNACHRSDGQGAQKAFPTLAGNTAVNAKDPTSLIRLVLQGSVMPQTATAPSPIGMPDFGWRLTDANVADVLTLVRSSWGNQSAAVTAQQVAKVRQAAGKGAAAVPVAKAGAGQ